MDVKSELPTQIEPLQSLDKGGKRFSPETFLENLGFVVKNRKFMGSLLGTISLWALITNPLNVPDPTPYLKNLLLGPTAMVQADHSDQTASKPNDSTTTEVTKTILTVEDQMFKNYTQKEKTDFNKQVEERLKDYREHDPERAERILDNWESTVDAIVNTYVDSEKRQFWKDTLLALLYIEGGGSSVKDLNKPTPDSEAGAMGPAQFTKDTFYETANKHPEVYSYDLKTKKSYIDPNNGFTSIRVAYLRLSDLLKTLENLDLALGGYFAGQTFVEQKAQNLQKMGIKSKDQINAANLGSEHVMKYAVDFVSGFQDIKGEQARKLTLVH